MLTAIEQAFAAQVVNAERLAALVRKHGVAYRAADVIDDSIAELWECAPGIAHAIADKYVEFVDGEPRARSLPSNVVPLT